MDSFKLDGTYHQRGSSLVLCPSDPPYVARRHLATLRRCIHRLLARVSEITSLVPASLFASGVSLPDRDPVAGGGFADVYSAELSGQRVALKRMRLFQLHSRERERVKKVSALFREALIWKQLSHPYILPCLGIDSDTFPSQQMCIVSPWMKHGSILDCIANKLRYVTELQVNTLLRQIAEGLEYLHSENIVHGDLRGANVLVDDAFSPRLADLGLSVFEEATRGAFTSTSTTGSTRWMAPELHSPESFGLEGARRTCASDVYAFACLCLEVYTEQPPFRNITSDFAIALKVTKGERPNRPSKEECHGKELRDDMWALMERCWSGDRSTRPNMVLVVADIQSLEETVLKRPRTAEYASESPPDPFKLGSDSVLLTHDQLTPIASEVATLSWALFEDEE
ncbi:hypothetical protein JAAARDRAFT_132054 [Jaapia argillacea MUCL 33604]|uniref:Protein kinase domain-containing protein n=1 Tax=Jaapia argillacea MUCL 33604 TaxID=933084 RepID=A0A067PPQ2_9AGAM|nr:hypothetical protein JAAARDRAFT_132054 [Jaapia argillacea MUCL 33604]